MMQVVLSVEKGLDLLITKNVIDTAKYEDSGKYEKAGDDEFLRQVEEIQNRIQLAIAESKAVEESRAAAEAASRAAAEASKAAEEAERQAKTVVSFRAQQLKELTEGMTPDASYLLVFATFGDGHEEGINGWSADIGHPVKTGENTYSVFYNGFSGTISLYASAAQAAPAPSQTVVQQAAQVAPAQSTSYVWIPTNGGTKYHRNSSCSKMKNPRQVTEAEALSLGFTPCKKCY